MDHEAGIPCRDTIYMLNLSRRRTAKLVWHKERNRGHSYRAGCGENESATTRETTARRRRQLARAYARRLPRAQ